MFNIDFLQNVLLAMALLDVGWSAVLTHLVSASHYNGSVCELVAWMPDKQRWHVSLKDAEGMSS